MTYAQRIALLLLCLTPTLGHADASAYVALDAKGEQAKPQASAMLVSFELSMPLLGNSASGGYMRLVRGPGKR